VPEAVDRRCEDHCALGARPLALHHCLDHLVTPSEF
jgi:hypothetical protein